MNINENSFNMNEVPCGILYSNDDRLEELNHRIHKRMIPDSNIRLTANFDIRGAPTRNCLVFPILDMKQNITQSQNSDYDFENSFAPIQKNAPFINFARKVDTESNLRSQIYALQHGAEQSVYVPSSNSELYKVSLPISSDNTVQPFLGLFNQNSQFKTTSNDFINSNAIGRDTFYNHTKTQLRMSEI
jgi:hypothetical protein